MNIVIVVAALLSLKLVDEKPVFKAFFMLHSAYFMMQLEILLICFAISAWIKRGETGIGIGLAAVFYFMDIIANISESAEFLKYISPFGYANAAEIIAETALDWKKLAIGISVSAAALCIGLFRYMTKDISA